MQKVNLMFCKEKREILAKEIGNAQNSTWNILQKQEVKS